ncbi:MAG: efflux RND transporter periplasmic adaptor subunit [Myxococcota bacterium]
MSRRALLPLLILGAGVLGVALMLFLRAGVPLAEPESVAPLVRAQSVAKDSFRFVVEGHGTVVPRTESDLVSQVEGEAVWVAPAFVPGGFFATGEILVRIDPADYDAALKSARAGLARTRSELSRATKERERQRSLANQSIASQARIDDAENAYAVAQANFREAKARLDQAERDLERTEIKAPYDGRVREKRVDVGQFVNRGTSLGRVYAVDYAEVRLPVPDRELSYLDLALGFQNGSPDVEDGPPVELHADFAGRPHTWTGRIVRTEGEIDPRSRTVNVVARVEDPYGRLRDEAVVPLSVGLFVEADILGREVGDAVVLPRVALQGDDRVLVIDGDNRLHFRQVDVLRVEREDVVIGGGLSAGERVCVSPLPGAVEGMTVRVAGDPPPDVASTAP